MKRFILKSILFSFIIMISFYCIPTLNNKVFADEEKINTRSKSALLYDAKSGTVIFEKDSDKKLPIASMTKIASLLIIFDAIDQGIINEDTLVKISRHAAETEGSSAFLDEKNEYKVSDLLMTVIVCSANDSTVALAEAVAGTEDAFVKMMNDKAKQLGLQNTLFSNSTGLPVLDHYSSAKDIAKIYTEICDNKIYKKYSKIWMTELIHPSGRKTDIVNTNKLIKSYEGCDSGKTGFTNDAGYCLAASATRSGMRLVGVVIGAENSKERFAEMADMFNYGFKNYENKTVIKEDQALYDVDVLNAKVKNIKIYPKEDYVRFLKKGESFEYQLDYKIERLKAPLKIGDKVGVLYILDKNNIVVHEEDLIVKEDVEEMTVFDIIKRILNKI